MVLTILDAFDAASKIKSVPELVEYVQEGDGAEILTTKEVEKICVLVNALNGSKTLSDVCVALCVHEDWVRELYGIPVDVIKFPNYAIKILACNIINNLIEDGRTRTCQICGRMFLSETEKFACETCENEFFDGEE